MYPAPFRYYRPDSLRDAIALLVDLGPGARVLAGGQTLIPILKLRLDEPAALIDISRIPDLADIRNDARHVEIGALATHDRIARSAAATQVPILRDCAGGIADAQIRVRGTIGGSICTADPSGDWPALLHVLQAEVVCRGRDGERSVPIKDFVVDAYTTTLDDGELMTAVRFKLPPAGSGGAYIGFKKAAPAYPAASAGVQLRLQDGICQDIRLVLGSAGPRPVTSEDVEAALRGKALTPERILRAADDLTASASPPTDARGTTQFKRTMLKKLMVRAVQTAVRRASGDNIEGAHDHV
jgi:carbon-monoxide dehydrogenase medium subunit